MYTVASRQQTFTMVAIMVSLLLSALDGTIVATAMPSILRDLNGMNLYTWVVTGYLLASTAMIPIYGKLSDLYGRKVILTISVILFLLGSLLSGMAPSMGTLIAFRALQGLGCAGITAISFTIAADIFPAATRGKYQGIISTVFGVSSIVGPWLGGFLTDALSWRWVFYVNMPIGLVALLFILTQMPALKPMVARKIVIDWWGVLTLLFGFVPLLLALTLGGQEYPWGSWRVIGLFVIAAVGILIFVLVERKAAEPIFSVRLLKNPSFMLGSLAVALTGGAGFMSALYFLPIYMVMVTGASASGAGMTVMPLMVGWAVSAFFSGQLVTRLGKYKGILLVGSALAFVGYLLLQGLSVDTTRAQVTWRMILLGLGLGPAIPILTLAVQNAVNPRDMGAATGSNQFLRLVGSTVGVAILGTMLASTVAARLPKYMPSQITEAGASSMSIDMSRLKSGNLEAVGDKIKAVTDDTYARIERALTSDDPAAVKSVLDDPLLPAEYKPMVQSSGLAAQVKAGLAPQASADAQRAARSTLAQVRTALDSFAAEVTGQVTLALKMAFTDAIRKVYFWALMVIAAGFVATLFMPQLPLKKSLGQESEQEDKIAAGA